MFVHLCGGFLEFRMILHLFAGNVMLPDFPEGKRRAVQVRSIVPIHISVYHRPFTQLGKPHLIDHVAIIVILIFRKAGDIPGIQTGGEHQFKGEDTVQPAVERRCDVLGILP